MNRFKHILAAALCLAAATASAQTSMSPYSRYGYGLLSDNATSAQKSMGSVGYAMRSGRQINVMNPASFAAVDSLTFLFDVGADITFLWSNDNSNSGHDIGGGLDYITMLFPVSSNIGVSLGLLPYSSVGYSFGSDIENGKSSRSGVGGLNQAYIGLGAEIPGGVSIGASASYLFGTTANDLYAYATGGSTSLFERVVQVRDYHLLFGAQYSLALNRHDRLTAGLSYSPAKSLLGHTYGVYYDTSASNAKPDTVGYTSLKGKYSLPDTWGAGIAYEHNNRLVVEADFTYQPWSKAKYAPLEDFEYTKMADRYRLSAGAQFTPEPRGSYLKRIQYRLGASYTRDYLMVHNNNVRELSLTAGLGIPTPSGKTIINLGFEYKNRRATPSPLVKENYFNITLGVNFNEMWFWRNKIR